MEAKRNVPSEVEMKRALDTVGRAIWKDGKVSSGGRFGLSVRAFPGKEMQG